MQLPKYVEIQHQSPNFIRQIFMDLNTICLLVKQPLISKQGSTPANTVKLFYLFFAITKRRSLR